MTQDEFLKELWEKNEYYRNNEFEVVGQYENSKAKLLIKDKYGLLSITPDSLFKSQKGSIKQAMNKESYFYEILKEVNPNIVKQVDVLKYYGDKEGVLINTKYGNCLGRVSVLKKLEDLSIQSAIDKKSFWIARALDLRELSENIDYSDANYSYNKNQVKLRCILHDYRYTQRPSHHMANIQGCPHCATSTIKYSKDNFEKHKEFFKDRVGIIYVIKLEGANEKFYKVGITGRDEKYRFETIGGNYKVLLEYKQEMLIEDAYKLEQRFLTEFKNYKYEPQIKFTGYTECLTTNPIAEYYNWYYNK